MIQNLNFEHQGKKYRAQLNASCDLSLPLRSGSENPNCYYADPPNFKTIEAEGFVGDVARGGSCNHRWLAFSPHGNGTHTECYGHISSDSEAFVPHLIQKTHFFAQLISLKPEAQDGDQVILKNQVQGQLKSLPEALIIRTLPNSESKKTRNYSGQNPPYLSPGLGHYLAQENIEHLLVDLPSVDRESDGGALSCHKNFWKYPEAPRKHCSISELIFVPNHLPDGHYLLNLQWPAFMNDACPSRPILYPLELLPDS